MRIYIVTPDPQTATVFMAAFKGTPVEINYGNLLEIAEDIIVSPANSYGYLDGGIDRVYRECFGPQLETDLLEAIARLGGRLQIGQALTICTPSIPRIRQIIFAPTVEMPEAVPSVNVFRATRAALREASRLERLSRLGEKAGHQDSEHSQLHTSRRPGVSRRDHSGLRVFFPAMGTGVGQVEAEDAAREMRLAWDRWQAAEAEHEFE